MARDLQDVDLLRIIYDLQRTTGADHVGIEEISQKVPLCDRTYSFRLMYALEMLGVIEKSSDRTSYKIVGSIANWKPRYPDDWEYDMGRISQWLEVWSSGGGSSIHQ